MAADIDVGDDQRQGKRERHLQEAGKMIVVRVGAVGAADLSFCRWPEYGQRAGAELGEADDGLEYREADEQVDQLPELRLAGGNGCQKNRQRHQEDEQGGLGGAGDQREGSVIGCTAHGS